MRPTRRLIGMLVVGAMLGSTAAPAQAHRDHDNYIVYVAPIAALGVLAVIALVTGVIGKKPQAAGPDHRPQTAVAAPGDVQREVSQESPALTAERLDSLRMRAEGTTGGQPVPRPLRFGLGCQQGLTEATVLCW